MNIAQAKEEIKRALQIYFHRDATGMYTTPAARQRPILLIGPPGIGKTAVMEQIAQECHVGLVAYTMTHHTRQSAIGLPRIVSRDYDGEQVQVTEYTLSEIIASIRDCIARTGLQEGILFIDEINCVSETLAPVMLQLLQNKTFGMHPVPAGWLICAAGNPPEYNRSARPFDLVTLDRVRTIPIEPDLACWLDYASARNVHEAVLSFLQMRPDAFYQAESNAARQVFVTARGWEDLSFLIRSSEELSLPVDEQQIRQYLGDAKTAKEFAAYYRLCCAARSDYNVRSILEGEPDVMPLEERVDLLRRASFEERYLVNSLMTGVLCDEIAGLGEEEDLLQKLTDFLRRFPSFQQAGAGSACSDAPISSPEVLCRPDPLKTCIPEEYERLEKRKAAGLLPPIEEHRQRQLLKLLEKVREETACRHDVTGPAQWTALTQEQSRLQAEAASHTEKILGMLDRAFSFSSKCAAQEQELLVLVSGLSRNQKAMHFLSQHRCEPFLTWSARLIPDE